MPCRMKGDGGPRRAAARRRRRVFFAALVLLAVCFSPGDASGRKKRKPPAGGRAAVVVDERLAAVREAPDLSAGLVQRLGRGRLVAVAGERRGVDGVRFYRVVLTRRTGGWVQAEALASASRAGDDERLLRLARASSGFERAERARIFLETFARSPHRPAVLLLLAEAAEEAADRLTREARRRLDAREMEATGAPLKSYFLNFNGLDRWRRQGVVFAFDAPAERYSYDGAAWREILRRYPRSPEAARARLKHGPPAGAR